MSTSGDSTSGGVGAALLEAFPDMFFLADAQDTLVAFHAPDPAELILPPGSLLGKSVFDVGPPELCALFRRAFDEVRSSGRSTTIVYDIQTPAGCFPYEARLVPRRDGGIFAFVRNVSTLRQSEARIRQQAELLEELRQIHSLSAAGSEPTVVFDKLLRAALRSTSSEFGFLGETREGPDGQIELHTRAISDISWDAASREVYRRLAPDSMVFRNMETLFGAALTSGQPVLSNDPSRDPRSGGVPPGHPPLRCFLGVPFFVSGQLCGMIGIANRPGGYTDEHVALLQPFLDSCANLSAFYRSERARKAAEEDRRKAQREAQRYQRLFEVASVCVAVASKDGQILDVNPSYRGVFGWEKADMLGNTLFSFVHPDDMLVGAETLRKAAEGDGSRVEIRHRCKDGGYRWGLAHVSYDPAEELLYGVTIDITEQRLRDRQVQEQIRLLEMSEAMSGVGHWYLDVSSERVRWSPQVCRIHGVEPGFSPTLQQALEFYLPEDRAEVQRLVAEAAQEQRSYQFEFRILRADGVVRWVASHGRPLLDGEGRLIAVFGVFHDISERREASLQMIEAKEQALRSAELKSQFMASMSHELRTPLNGILGAASLLLGRLPPGVPREELEIIQDSGRILLATINDILDFSRIESGKLEVERVSFSLQTLVDDSIRMFSAAAKSKGLRLGGGLAPGLSVFRVGDPVRLRQVLTNLLGNAIKFTEQGEVSLWLSAGEGERVLGQVTDSGPGVPAARRDAIFEPFVQGDGSTTRKYGGSGLGLAICRELLARMGGRIWYEEAPSGGARMSFSLDLPEAPDAPDALEIDAPMIAPVILAEREAEEDAPAPCGPSAGARGLHILLAEDNPINARITRKMLEQDGHRLVVVGDGRAALEALRAASFDLVLMDVQMPVMDGLEATATLRREEQGRRRHPVIMITANAMKGDRELCLAAGADAYLAKPFTSDELLGLVRQLGAS